MSLRAKLIRAGLRLVLKHHGSVDIAKGRKQIKAAERWVPNPPRRTRIAKFDANGVSGLHISMPTSHPDRHILYLHGGGYNSGSPALYRDFTWRIAEAAAAHVWCIDYRLAPEYPFPAALNDTVTAYRWLLDHVARERQIAVTGDSAGGGLLFAALLKLRDQGIVLPAAAVAISPWTDLALSGESLRTMADGDPIIFPEAMPIAVNDYLAGADPRAPYASPLYGDMAGLPATLILVGGAEALRDDSTRIAERMRRAGCDARLEIWPGMFHAWHMFARVMPEARQMIARAGAFLQARL
jgi:epsilon-lactone hydrolase